MLLTIGPNNSTGFRKHLEELSNLIEEGKFIAVDEKDAKMTLPKIIRLRPTLTIIGGKNWVKRNKKILKKIPGAKGILYTSPLAQAEISGDEIKNLKIYFEWLDSGEIDYLFFSSKGLANRFKQNNILHLPAPSKTDFKLFEEKKKFPNINNIGLINDKANHKNILNSIAGISLSSRLDELVINGLFEEYDYLLKKFGLGKITKNMRFLPEKKYNRVVQSLKLMVHLSFSESYCYSVFEAMARGTPILVSKAVDWVKIKELIVNDPRDHKEIAKKIDFILNLSRKDYIKLSDKCRRNAMESINNNNNLSQKTIKQLLRSLD